MRWAPQTLRAKRAPVTLPTFRMVKKVSRSVGLGGSDAGDDLLVWREDPTGRQPERLILLDTPDIDGTLRENWHRAELVRNAADVLIAVLTQQKYNDAAVRDSLPAVTGPQSIAYVFPTGNGGEITRPGSGAAEGPHAEPPLRPVRRAPAPGTSWRRYRRAAGRGSVGVRR